jgi:hypothetical protein
VKTPTERPLRSWKKKKVEKKDLGNFDRQPPMTCAFCGIFPASNERWTLGGNQTLTEKRILRSKGKEL